MQNEQSFAHNVFAIDNVDLSLSQQKNMGTIWYELVINFLNNSQKINKKKKLSFLDLQLQCGSSTVL